MTPPSSGTSTHHSLKCLPEFFAAVSDGTKTFEVRAEWDRTFAVGDTLTLRQWNPETESYSGTAVWLDVTYVLRGHQWGLRQGYAVLGIQPIDTPANAEQENP